MFNSRMFISLKRMLKTVRDNSLVIDSDVRCCALERSILGSAGSSVLIPVIEEYSNCCTMTARVEAALLNILQRRSAPGVVAAALTALGEAGLISLSVRESVTHFLDYEAYQSEWYDEVVASVRLYHRSELGQVDHHMQKGCKALVDHAKKVHDDDFIKYCSRCEQLYRHGR